MKKRERKLKSWVEEKLTDDKFRKQFEEEYYKLSIAEQLIRLRMLSGLTQAQLAKKTGTTASAISRYENVEYDRYELQTLRKIVAACGGRLKIIVEASSDTEAA